MCRLILALVLLGLGGFCLGGLNLPHFKTERALAQDLDLGIPKSVPSGGGSYTGPGDIQSGASGFYSCARAYNAAYAASLGPACKLADQATGLTTYTMNFLSTGFANAAGAAASAACAVACVVTIAYDQTSVLGNASTPTAGDEPVLTFNALGGLPCMTFPATMSGQGGLISANNANIPQPFGIESIWNGPTTNGAAGVVFSAAGGAANTGVRVYNSTSYWYYNPYGVNGPGFNAAQNKFNSTQSDFNGSSGVSYLNGSSQGAQNIGTSAFGNGTVGAQVGGEYYQSNGFNGPICEIGIWPASIASNAPALVSNQQSGTYGYGVTFPH